jgi:hypothetical protein
MQNRSIFPYRRHGPKKRVKHGPNRKPRGPQKGLPNSARDLLPMLQPATKALAQVLAGRAGASGQLGHARTMLAQAERMIAERAHNRLTPSEREEFFEQLARLKLTLADADAEAEVQAVEQHEPRPPAAPVAQERLKEMALALSGRERPSQSGAQAGPAASEAGTPEAGEASAHEGAPQAGAEPVENPEAAPEPAREPEAGARTGEFGAAARGGRLMLPKASADQAVQALSIGGLARRRSRAMSWAAAASAADAANWTTPARGAAAGAADASPPAATPEPDRGDPSGAAGGEQHSAERPDDAGEAHGGEAHGGNGTSADVETTPRAKAARRGRKPKQQGLPEGWVIDEEGFVVPGAG